ncbi:MAG: hypothetical protein HC778_00025 [Chamaesiphon sp. CSU_1_12]|nr:hypothetical protein [Chamaesiphon sp. CSU_1_12]
MSNSNKHSNQSAELERYLTNADIGIILNNDNTLIIQLANLKLAKIEIESEDSYSVQEITKGKQSDIWSKIGFTDLIYYLEEILGSPFFKPWHVDDILANEPDLDISQARAVLRLAIENHDATIGINWEVLGLCANRIRKQKSNSKNCPSSSPPIAPF